MNKKTLFLGGSSLLAHSWCNQITTKDRVILGIHNRPTELDEVPPIRTTPKIVHKLINKLNVW